MNKRFCNSEEEEEAVKISTVDFCVFSEKLSKLKMLLFFFSLSYFFVFSTQISAF